MVLPLHDDNPTSRFPFLIVLLIAVNVLVYFVVQPHGGSSETEFTLERAAIPCELDQDAPLTETEFVTSDCGATGDVTVQTSEGPAVAEPVPIFPGKNVWLAVLTSMFLHGSLFHLAGNMLFLWVFGNNVEDHLGWLLFPVFYVVTGVVAFAAHYLADPGSTVPVIGASGAIAGVMGAYLVFWPRARVLTWVVFVLVPLPAAVILAVWFALQFFTESESGIAWLAHVGGFVAGVVLAFLLQPIVGRPENRRRPLEAF
jgi:membrane associated rhomboid family serine protease